MDIEARHHRQTHRRRPASPYTQEQALEYPLELGALGELILNLVTQEDVESVSIVGLEWIVSESSQTAYMQGVCDAIVATIDGTEGASDPEGLPRVQDFLRFYTHEQFRGNVREERYRLVTVQ